jgi:ABC-type transport system involved in multi-copper enzyme maturation permease subunit
MKLWAILKDSFREALDTTVFYVMIGTSAVLALLVGSVGFTPQPAAEIPELYTTLPLNLDPAELAKIPVGLPMGPKALTSLYTLVKVETQDRAPDRPDSPLRFTIKAQYVSRDEAAKVRADPTPAREFVRERFGAVGDWKAFDVTRVEMKPADSPNQVLFDVYTRPNSSTPRVWPHEPSLFFNSISLTALKSLPLAFQVWWIEDQLVNGLGAWVAILVSVILTAFFIPNMLRKGTVDLLLVKPIHRTTLLIYKYLGGLIFILLNTAMAIGSVWLVLGLRSGIWATGFLLTILVVTFFFGILYSLSTLFGVLTRSPIVAILLTCGLWFVFYAVGRAYVLPDEFRQNKETAHLADGRWVDVVKAIHFVTPRVKDLDYLISELLYKELLRSNLVSLRPRESGSISWRESLAVDGGFIAVMLGLACWRFATKDY